MERAIRVFRIGTLASITIARDTINEMINTYTHYYERELATRDTDESAVLKVRRMNVHLKGQGKMQVSNGRVGKKFI